MWNRGFRILWIKVETSGERHFYLNIPVSISVFGELLDCVLDFMEFVCLFVPKHPPLRSPHAVSAREVKELIKATDKLFLSISTSEPYDLVEVNVKNVAVSIRIR